MGHMESRHDPRNSAPVLMEAYTVRPILCSQAEAGKMLAIGKTKLAELISSGQIESLRIGRRRLVRISSLQRLAGIETNNDGEA